MNKEFPTFDHFEEAMNRAIDKAMATYICDRIKREIQEQEDAKVYSYEPEFWSRRYTAGGIADKALMSDDYDSSSKTLTITIDTPWQQLRNGKTPLISLAEAIEKGLYMHGAGARPFVQETEAAYAGGTFENDLQSFLAWSGLSD